MTNKQRIEQSLHYEICNSCGLSESDSTEAAANWCTIITSEEMVKLLGWVGSKNEHLNSEELVQLYLNQQTQ